MATIGLAAAGLGLSFVLLGWSESGYVSEANRLGYSKISAEEAGEIFQWSLYFDRTWPSLADSLRRGFLEEQKLSAAQIDSVLAMRFPTTENVKAVVLNHARKADYSERDAVERRQRLFAIAAAIPAPVALGILMLWWWRWFGARAAPRP